MIWAVVACGPSLTQADVDKLKGRVSVCTVNNAYELAPWANAHYASDRNWWAQHYAKMQHCEGEMWGLGGNPCLDKVRALKYETGRGGLAEAEPILAATNSGHAAINLVHAIYGAVKIGLLGFDFQRTNDKAHFFGDYTNNLHNPTDGTCRRWAVHMPALAEDAKRLGVEIINCTPTTALNCFPRMTLDEWLAHAA